MRFEDLVGGMGFRPSTLPYLLNLRSILKEQRYCDCHDNPTSCDLHPFSADRTSRFSPVGLSGLTLSSRSTLWLYGMSLHAKPCKYLDSFHGQFDKSGGLEFLSLVVVSAVNIPAALPSNRLKVDSIASLQTVCIVSCIALVSKRVSLAVITRRNRYWTRITP